MPEVSLPFTFNWTHEIEAFFEKNRIYLAHVMRFAGIYEPGTKITISSRVKVESYATMFINRFVSTGCHTYTASLLPHDVVLGRYCSIGQSLAIMGLEHPTDRFSTSPLTYSPRFADIAKKDFGREFPQVPFRAHAATPKFGHDVWVGENVRLKTGITIGNGAIIAAGAIVTKDVPPYAIVGGVPAKLIRMRFSTETIERMERLCWWDYPFFDLPGKDTWSSPEQFLDELERMIETGSIQKADIKTFDLCAEIAALI